MSIIQFLTAFVVIANAQTHTGTPFVFQNQPPIPFEELNVYSALTIGVELGRGDPVVRAVDGSNRQATLDLDRLRVVASNAYPVGSTITVLSSRFKNRPNVEIPIGHQILLVAAKVQNGILAEPIASNGKVVGHVNYSAESNSEVLGLAFYDTNQTTLPQETDTQWQFLEALAGAIPGTCSDNIENIRLAMGSPPGLTSIQLGTGHGSDRFSRLFENAVAGQPAYNRALIYLSLNSFRYYGFADKYLAAVLECSGDPTAFPRGIGRPFYWEDPSLDNRLPPDFKHDEPDKQAWVDAIVKSQNPVIYRFLLQNLPFTPDSTLEKHVSTLLDDPDPHVRWTIVHNLADWHNDQDHAPLPSRTEVVLSGGSRVIYPGLAKMVAYWKAQLNH